MRECRKPFCSTSWAGRTCSAWRRFPTYSLERVKFESPLRRWDSTGAEILFRHGLYHDKPVFPSRIGYEACGAVDAVGPGVEDLVVGDRVSTIPCFSMVEHGVCGEQAVVPAFAAARYPDNLSPAKGAAIWMQYFTAYGALIEFGGLKEGDTVLLTAASSSVGVAAIQIAKSVGARVIATTRGAGKKDFLLNIGADRVVVTDEEDLAESVMEITGGAGADIVFDPVVGSSLEKIADATAYQGSIFLYGRLSPEPAVIPLFPALRKGLTFRCYTIMEITKFPEKRERGKKFIYDGLESGALKPIIAKTFPLDEAAGAYKYMESNQQMGKIVVEV